MQKETSSGINKVLAAILIGIMFIFMIGIVVNGWQTDKIGENSGDGSTLAPNADNLNGDTDINGGTADNFTNIENTPSNPTYVNYITGLPVSEESLNRVPFVMVTNPLALSYGISDSELTVEVPTENGNTRFLIYKTEISGLGKLGAFEKTRNYISQLTSFFGGLIISSGNDDIISYSSINTDIAINLSNYGDATYIENGKHVYTDGNNIIKISKNENIDLYTYKPQNVPFNFCDFGKSVFGNSPATDVLIPYSSDNETSFAYDYESQTYILYKNERIKVDMLSGNNMTYKNVFVLFADVVTYETAYGTESVVKTATEGKGYYISNGTLTEIRWHVDSLNNLIFKDLNGNKLTVNRGNSYIGYCKSSNLDAVVFK